MSEFEPIGSAATFGFVFRLRNCSILRPISRLWRLASIRLRRSYKRASQKLQETRKNPESRHIWKLRLVRGLYEQGFSAKDVRKLLRLIDWLMELPEALAIRFRQEVATIQEEKKMPYVTSFERIARREGLREGIEAALTIRFGDEGLKLMPEMQEVHSLAQLQAILRALTKGVSLEEIRTLTAFPPPDSSEASFDVI